MVIDEGTNRRSRARVRAAVGRRESDAAVERADAATTTYSANFSPYHHVSASARTPSATDWWCAVTAVAEAPPTIIAAVNFCALRVG